MTDKILIIMLIVTLAMFCITLTGYLDVMQALKEFKEIEENGRNGHKPSRPNTGRH